MPTILEVAGPLAQILTPVPPPGPGVCEVCRGSPDPGDTVCRTCAQAMRQVSRPCERVVPFCLYRSYSQMGRVLRQYKDNADPKVRADFSLQVAAFLGVALVMHGECLRQRYGDWDVITTVPSTSGNRTGLHPFAGALSMVEDLRSQYAELLAPGAVQVGHNYASDDGFVTTQPVVDRRVLLVDDTYTSGARVQSAASRLQLDGATVPAIVVLGRVINPDWAHHTTDLWNQQRGIAFSFDTCAEESVLEVEDEEPADWEPDWDDGWEPDYDRDDYPEPGDWFDDWEPF